MNARQSTAVNRPPRLGEGDRCPVCGATSGVSGEQGAYLCLVCGAPRILVDGIVQRRGNEKPLLERAKSLKLHRAAYAVVAALALMLGVVSLTFGSIAALFFGASSVKGLAFGFVSLLPLAAALGFFVATRRASTKVADALARAELIVAKELIASGSAKDASMLARLMHLPAGRAEETFGQAEVERLLDVDDAPGRLRVATDDESSLQVDDARERMRQR